MLDHDLADHQMTRQQFYDGVILHGPTIGLPSDQWLDFHRKIPHWRLRDDRALMNLMSENQREMLNKT